MRIFHSQSSLYLTVATIPSKQEQIKVSKPVAGNTKQRKKNGMYKTGTNRRQLHTLNESLGGPEPSQRELLTTKHPNDLRVDSAHLVSDRNNNYCFEKMYRPDLHTNDHNRKFS